LPLASGLSITCKGVSQLKLRSPGVLQLRIFDYLNQIATARLRSYILRKKATLTRSKFCDRSVLAMLFRLYIFHALLVLTCRKS
jgi:hypothetical protein